jgi:hypothetical protein
LDKAFEMSSNDYGKMCIANQYDINLNEDSNGNDTITNNPLQSSFDKVLKGGIKIQRKTSNFDSISSKSLNLNSN